MSNEKSVRQVLVDARELLDEHYGSGDLYYPATGCFCALGAIAAASGVAVEDIPDLDYDRIRPDAVEALAEAVVLQDNAFYDDEPCETVWNYNDRRGREPTLEAFDAAIANLPE